MWCVSRNGLRVGKAHVKSLNFGAGCSPSKRGPAGLGWWEGPVELTTSLWPHTCLSCCHVTITALRGSSVCAVATCLLAFSAFPEGLSVLEEIPCRAWRGGTASFLRCLWETLQEPLSFSWRSEFLLVFLCWGVRAQCVHVSFNSFAHEFVSSPHVAAMPLSVGNYYFRCYLRSYRPG